MRRLSEIVFFIFAINLKHVGSNLTSAESECDSSSVLAIAKLIYNNPYVSYKESRSDYHKHKLYAMCLEYGKLMLLLAIASQQAIKINLSSKSNLLIQNSIQLVTKRVVSFYFVSRLAISFNRMLTGACYKNSEQSKEVQAVNVLSNGVGMVR